ncbi:hypothetical protein CPLU01_15906 [Colletotrichum plurivorum]|uniref:Uncharacterized protein n=1 Tax=Colletotrichum plurivorum TaxID=2175906 RepID=A0A8H6J4P8_9PEZI|nr:hypothetical protein CPLU01_15906 [Colletotrichum plurivorum]
MYPILPAKLPSRSVPPTAATTRLNSMSSLTETQTLRQDEASMAVFRAGAGTLAMWKVPGYRLDPLLQEGVEWNSQAPVVATVQPLYVPAKAHLEGYLRTCLGISSTVRRTPTKGRSATPISREALTT